MKTTRRQFIGGAAAVGIGFPALVRGQNLNSRLAHACIGTGGKGESDWQNFIKHPKVDIVAGCDVDTARMAGLGPQEGRARPPRLPGLARAL